VKNDFSVIDVNIPRYYTDADVSTCYINGRHIADYWQDDGRYVHPEDDFEKATIVRELMAYLWENYIE